MNLQNVLKLSESWADLEEIDEEKCKRLEQDVKSCMRSLQEYFQDIDQNAVTETDMRTLASIQQNYQNTMIVIQEKKQGLRSALDAIRKGRESKQLYKDVASL